MWRKLIIVSALPACFVLGICAQIVSLSSDRYEHLQQTVSPDYKLTGYYYPAHGFSLVFDNVRRLDLTPQGYLVTDYDVYKLSGVNINGDVVSFTTEQRIGVSYQFTGRVQEGDYMVHGYVSRTVVFDGRLARLLFGFKVAEREVRFAKGSAC